MVPFNSFLSMLTLGLAVTLFFTGGMTTYFGEGKTKLAGVAQIIIGIAAILVSFLIYLAHYPGKYGQAFISLLGGVVGALIGVGIFLVTIIKA